ncbi:hypothetical protein LEP1GSC137_1889 [Leptospira borgpetersenii str. Noumea 25]|nr:hypothetical protein LEP1GSC066_3138 [Leptospira sp. serovar Kenya str. Sh9]EMO08532.1 hypothetical protein LEP1GSC137_1889 [Leptospira borgpetersenii str. Noumea 25]
MKAMISRVRSEQHFSFGVDLPDLLDRIRVLYKILYKKGGRV